MKKHLLSLLALVLVGTSSLSAQDYQNEFRHNEIKLNLIGIFMPAIELQYDYIIRPDMSVGADVSFGLGDAYPIAYQVTPNYRWFFGGNTQSAQKYGAGFFIEANLAAFGYRHDMYENGQSVRQMETGFGLGAAIGWKYLSTGNWVGEVFIGAGKNFLDTGLPAYPRGGLMIGYRF